MSCPICGENEKGIGKHRCKESKLRAIDSARDKRDPDSVLERRKPAGQRIDEGYLMLSLGEDDYEDDDE